MRDRMRTHYTEADNELHHLLIMEALGGNASSVDRAFAQGMAFFYYWYVVLVYSISEQAAYHLSELIEDHAYYTYDAFLERKADELKLLPVPPIAREYYDSPTSFPFTMSYLPNSEDQGETTGRGRPPMQSLYDVFVNVRDDEAEHWQTLCSLVQYDSLPSTPELKLEATKPAPLLK
uniref:Alternative oxidase n=2 Tax=Chrysotila carterae TaxID=13221 RepID=A0A7S4BIR9_CHRCT